MMASVGVQWPLVGRAEELDLLDQTLTGSQQGVVLSGPTGVGKSRLAAELLARASRAGWHTLRTCATRSMATVPFGALINLLPASGAPAGSTTELLQRLRSELDGLAGDPGVLLLVDDAHLLDDASAAAVHMLAMSGTAFVVVTVRSHEPVPDAIAALWKDNLAMRLELQPLSCRETGELLQSVVGGQVDTVTTNRLWQVTRGNVLYLSELVRALRSRGNLAERDGIWSWPGDLVVGDRLAELIEARLGGLTAAERSLLDVLALGEPLEPGLLAKVAGQSMQSLHALETTGLVSITDDGGHTQVHLGHPLYGKILRSALGVLRRRALFGALATAMTGWSSRRRQDLIRLVTWRLDAGESPDASTLVAAAWLARELFDHRLAERFARCAVDAGGDADAHVLLADELYWQDRYHEALTVLARIPADATRPADSLMRQAIVTASTLFWGLGDMLAAERALLQTQHCLRPGAEHDELSAHRATILLFNGRPGEALSLAEPVLSAATATVYTRARALLSTILALAVTGRTEPAITAAQQALTLAGEVADRDPWSLSECQAGLATAYWLAGRLDDMHHLAETTYAEATARSADDVRGLWGLLTGRALLAKGRVRSALTQLREATELLRQHDAGRFLSWSLATQATAAAQLGDLDTAEARLADADQCRHPALRSTDTEHALARAWLAAARGELSRAGRLALDAASAAAASGQCVMAAFALHDATRFGMSGLQQRITALAAKVDGVLVPTLAAHARALAATDGTGLDEAARRFEAAGAMLLAAEAATQAAQAHERSGHAAAQMTARNKAHQLLAHCEEAVTPVLRAAAEQPEADTLTSREREIAGLAARGLSNRDIAAQLVLSVRTVGNHLNHIYGKLGISREDLPALLNVRSAD